MSQIVVILLPPSVQGVNSKYPLSSKSFVERTAVKSAPKKPCSMPDQKVSGTIRSCFLRPSCLRILFSLFVLGTAKDCCVIRYLIVAERSLRPDICSLPSFDQMIRDCKVQISLDRVPDYCLLRNFWQNTWLLSFERGSKNAARRAAAASEHPR